MTNTGGTMSPMRHLQEVGRALRAIDGKPSPQQMAVIFDCVDGFTKATTKKAARQSAINLVTMIQLNSVVLMSNGDDSFVRKPWWPFRYRHRIRIDMIPITLDRDTHKPLNFKNFRPEGHWSVRSEGSDVVFMFRNENDLALFKLAVL